MQMLESLAVLAMVWIAISAVYFLKNKKATGTDDQYLWVGEGKHPFKK
ncbi:hypothetical protein KY332_05360 [Candidatus Woesearchaeota archaeon]|nr:hypothetical protein [Candidatus Woesearchaeota archaeon]